MKKYIFLFTVLISGLLYSQEYNSNCLACAEAQGFYCGDDESNWTQYAPLGCVINGWLNDGWEDCVDASDENGAVPTSVTDCIDEVIECDTVYVDVPVIQTDTIEVPFYIYETELIFDTIVETEYITQVVIDTVIEIEVDTLYNTEYITQIVVDTLIEEVEVLVPEYIYVTDTIYAEILDTLFIDVVEYVDVEVIVTDTLIETEYVEFFTTDTIVQYDTIINTEYVEIVVIDTVMEYIEIINTEYMDCDTGLPCNNSIGEIIKESEGSFIMYNLYGQHIRKPQGIYIQNGEVKWLR